MKKTLTMLLCAAMVTGLFATSAAASSAESTSASSAVSEAEDALVVNTTILLEADDAMINNYSLLAVNPEAPFVDADENPVEDVYVNTVGADALINWLLSEEGEDAAANFGVLSQGKPSGLHSRNSCGN